MSDLRKAAQQALEALERMRSYGDVFLHRSHEQKPYEQVCDAITALRSALEQPEQDTRSCTCHPDDNPPKPCPRKYALSECRKAALEQPEQEPVAWRYKYSDGFWRFSNGARVNGCDPIESQALYTAPPQRKPLPKHDQHCVDVPGYGLMAVRLVRAVERVHGIEEKQ